MAISSTFSAAKLDSLLMNYCSSSSASFSGAYFPYQQQMKVFPRPNYGNKGMLSRNGGVRCEAAEFNAALGPQKIDPSKASALSALQQLKTSAADRYTKERSSIVVIGLSVHTAPVEMREKLAIPEAEMPRAIGVLCGLNHIEEAAVLSTCNRMEIYVVALSQHRGVKEVTEWMSKRSFGYIDCSMSLHGPMQHLRCDGNDGRTLNEALENMNALNRMFGLESDLSLVEQKIRAKVEQSQK
ncbi:hypothetical protein GOBAR_AA31185 [Gossypium barbadense]|uniref:Glutamyl-tRNA reductase N-terminal domain-containing protein n=1 Tax=Gossypium barbadense TaxID=3634 RepID=A0A2P5WEI6_GOSBA|nr:hypothetical protein GOBAR_AA31185 [Gossypium barbadense]